jgi:hypothetical protein
MLSIRIYRGALCEFDNQERQIDLNHWLTLQVRDTLRRVGGELPGILRVSLIDG